MSDIRAAILFRVESITQVVNACAALAACKELDLNQQLSVIQTNALPIGRSLLVGTFVRVMEDVEARPKFYMPACSIQTKIVWTSHALDLRKACKHVGAGRTSNLAGKVGLEPTDFVFSGQRLSSCLYAILVRPIRLAKVLTAYFLSFFPSFKDRVAFNLRLPPFVYYARNPYRCKCFFTNIFKSAF